MRGANGRQRSGEVLAGGEPYCPGSRAGPGGGASQGPGRMSSAARPAARRACGPWAAGTRWSGEGAFCGAPDSSGTKPETR